MFLGDNVKDQNFGWAEFEALGSSPPSLEAAKALDAVSRMPGMELSQSDALSAYTQTFLGGNPWRRHPNVGKHSETPLAREWETSTTIP